MKKLTAALLLIASLLPLHAAPSESDAEVEARRTALEVAGAFSNEGFKLRDGHQSGPLAAKQSALVQVNLYAGNEYWFTVGTSGTSAKVAVTVLDETGKPLESEPYADGTKAAAGFAPEVSGPYTIRIEATAGDPTTYCLLYSYK